MIVISLGAGVQSTTMALMAKHGDIGPMPDCAIFADTGWEPKHVYEHLAWLEGELPFPVHRVSAGDLRADQMNRSNTTGQRFAAVPWHMKMPNGEATMGRRQCTSEYKLRPIQRKCVALTGGRRKGSVEMWVGISTDEAQRMKESRVKYIKNRWPLYDARMNRNDCMKWLERNYGREAPKSSCIGCPFHNNRQWRDLRDNHPDEWADAILVDGAIRNQSGFRGEQYMHRSLKPLAEVDLSTAEDHGQLNFFNEECEGMCGV